MKTFGAWRRSGESQIHYILINDVHTLEWLPDNVAPGETGDWVDNAVWITKFHPDSLDANAASGVGAGVVRSRNQ